MRGGNCCPTDWLHRNISRLSLIKRSRKARLGIAFAISAKTVGCLLRPSLARQGNKARSGRMLVARKDLPKSRRGAELEGAKKKRHLRNQAQAPPWLAEDHYATGAPCNMSFEAGWKRCRRAKAKACRWKACEISVRAGCGPHLAGASTKLLAALCKGSRLCFPTPISAHPIMTRRGEPFHDCRTWGNFEEKKGTCGTWASWIFLVSAC